MELEKIEMYQIAMKIGEMVWKVALNLDSFARSTVGNQIVRSSDSIAANISEGEGMFHFGDRRRFLYYARGSSFETKTWIMKMTNRELIPKEDSILVLSNVDSIIKLINAHIRKIPHK